MVLLVVAMVRRVLMVVVGCEACAGVPGKGTWYKDSMQDNKASTAQLHTALLDQMCKPSQQARRSGSRASTVRPCIPALSQRQAGKWEP